MNRKRPGGRPTSPAPGFRDHRCGAAGNGGVMKSEFQAAMRCRLSNQTQAQQIGIQQPFDRRPSCFDLLECRHEQSRIVPSSASGTHRQRRAASAVGFHRFRPRCTLKRTRRRRMRNGCGAHSTLLAQRYWKLMQPTCHRSRPGSRRFTTASSDSCPNTGHAVSAALDRGAYSFCSAGSGPASCSRPLRIGESRRFDPIQSTEVPVSCRGVSLDRRS